MIASLAMVLALAPATMTWSLTIDRGGSSYSFGIAYRSANTQIEDDRSYPMGTFASAFRGLTKEQLAGNGNVRFDVVRQEGTLACSGTARGGSAGGTFTYTLDAGFASALARRGVTGSLSEDTQLGWLLEDADVSGILDALGAVNAPVPSVEQLRRAFDHGVTANYVRALASAGLRVDLDEASRLVDHGVTPRYLEALAQYGYRGLSADALVRLADHGVTPRYLEALAQYGYRNFPVESIVRLADHGVTPHYLAGLAQNGYHVTPDQAIELADHGVTVQYIEHLRQTGYANLSVSDLIQLADHGIH